MTSGHGEPYKFRTVDEIMRAYDNAKTGRERLQEAIEKIAGEIAEKGHNASLSWIWHTAKSAIERDAEE
jgi:hypothetical protein